ncbi:unnamed protein product [Bursaphelenchus xylophilus]|uniref:(pine wood nematode) hypothetical protein n=1 Tax=Bursaphelenchus xylophilus TaxID=6326 RepID=A0A1I7SBR3_BURXY|nr:unnamed protein product [Bursaphelenchus xylophilus]CAG9111190.1 unnamed protein product [Bursaphelenchus xylophilus]
MRWLIKLQRWQRKRAGGVYHGDLYRISKKDRLKRIPNDVLERKQRLPEGPNTNRAGDCVFFNGSCRDGCYLALGFAQRPGAIANIFFVLHIPGKGTFVNEDLLSTSNLKTIPNDHEYVSESGFKISCLRPMEMWRIEFNGSLVNTKYLKQDLTKPGEGKKPQDYEAIDTKFELDWTAKGDHFDFDTDISVDLISRSLAIEPWSRTAFKNLQSRHNIHYEQFGSLRGSVFLNGDERVLSLVGLRDHTVAPYRNWSEIRRYVMIMFALEDGTCVNTSCISMPEQVFSHLQFGYVIHPDGSKTVINKLNLHLAYIGENKQFPDEFHYTFETDDHYKLQVVNVVVKERVAFKMGLDLNNYLEELLCEFSLNGVKGTGFCEINYRISPY